MNSSISSAASPSGSRVPEGASRSPSSPSGDSGLVSPTTSPESPTISDGAPARSDPVDLQHLVPCRPQLEGESDGPEIWLLSNDTLRYLIMTLPHTFISFTQIITRNLSSSQTDLNIFCHLQPRAVISAADERRRGATRSKFKTETESDNFASGFR